MPRPSSAAVRALLSVVASCVVSGACLAANTPTPPRESGIQQQETVEVVEAWPFLLKGEAANCDGLERTDLEILEGGAPVRVISVDQAERPSTHVLLLDTSASMSDRRRAETRKRAAQTKAAAQAYVDWMLEDSDEFDDTPGAAPQRSPDVAQELMVLTFDDDMIMRAPRSTVKNRAQADRLRGIIDGISGGQQTFLNDSLYRLVSYLGGYPERAVVIVLSDGADTGAGRGAEEVLQIVNETNNVTVFPIGIGLQDDYHEDYLEEIAHQSGGRYFGIRDKKPESLGPALEKRFQEIRDRLRREHYVSYVPEPEYRWLPEQWSRDPRGNVSLSVRMVATKKKCKIDPSSYRPRRFVRRDSSDEIARRADAGIDVTPGAASDSFELPLRDVVRDPGFLRFNLPRAVVRAVEVVVPPFQRASGVGEARVPPTVRVEDLVYGWLQEHELPSAPETPLRSRTPLDQELNGKSFLDQRAVIARAVFSSSEAHREWARAKIGARIREEYRHKLLQSAQPEASDTERQKSIEQQLEALVSYRLSQPTDDDLQRELAEWHGDVSARNLALRIERIEANRLLAAPPSANGEIDGVQTAWMRFYEWLRPPGRVRITTPLILTHDPTRNVFGFSRIVLPRLESWPYDNVPEQPYGLQLVRWLLNVRVFTTPGSTGFRSERSGLAEAVKRKRIRSIWYREEIVPPTDETQIAEVLIPVARNRYYLRFVNEDDPGETETIHLVADTYYRRPLGWNRMPPSQYFYFEGWMRPAKLEPRCLIPREDGVRGELERLLLDGGIPRCES